MTHALVTIVAPIDAEKLKILPDLISKRLGNPAERSIEQGLGPLDEDGESSTHFASLHAIPAGAGTNGYLIFEFSADGSDDEAVARFDRQIGGPLKEVFSHASDWREGVTLLAYLHSHVIQIGAGLFSAPGVAFAGTPGMSVGRIRKERDLAAEITKLVGQQQGDIRAIDRLAAVRSALAAQKDFAWALDPPPPPLPDNAG